MGWLRNKAAKVEARQWAGVSQWMRPAEQPVNYIRIRENGTRGWLYLTSQRLLWTEITSPGQEILAADPPLNRLEEFAQVTGDRHRMGAFIRGRDGEQVKIGFQVPADVPAVFVTMFIQQVRSTAGLG